jgi:hypothetical protein
LVNFTTSIFFCIVGKFAGSEIKLSGARPSEQTVPSDGLGAAGNSSRNLARSSLPLFEKVSFQAKFFDTPYASHRSVKPA